ncbi:MAG: endonuclease domain-containing protein [Devosia sp.]
MSIAQARSQRKHMSPAEARMWILLRTQPFRPAHFRRQVPLGPYYADFASHSFRLVIEVDGSQHMTDAAGAHDARRTAYLESEGYRVLRFTTIEVLRQLDAVGSAVLGAIEGS